MHVFQPLRSHEAKLSLVNCVIRAMIEYQEKVTTDLRRPPMFARNRDRQGAHGEVAADAERLIARFAERAYFEARDRVAGRCVDGTRSRRYWTRVKLEIAKRQGIAIGLAAADAWARGEPVIDF